MFLFFDIATNVELSLRRPKGTRLKYLQDGSQNAQGRKHAAVQGRLQGGSSILICRSFRTFADRDAVRRCVLGIDLVWD